MKIKHFILLFLLLTANSAFSQTSTDLNLKKKLEYYKNIDSDSTLILSKKLKHSKNEAFVILAFSTESYAYYRKKNYAKSEEVSIALLKKINQRLTVSRPKRHLYDGKIAALNRLFWIKKNQENYQKAYEYLILMNQTNEQISNKDIKYFRNKLSIKTSKAIIKEALKMELEAKSILINAYKDTKSDVFKKIAQDNYFLQQKANISNSLGNIYMSLYRKDSVLTHIDSASYFYDIAYKTTRRFNPLHKDSDIIYSFRKTEVLIAKKEYNAAINEINQYAKISNGYHYKHREYFQKAICFHNLNKVDSTIFYANKLINDNKEKCKRSKLITIYDILSKQYDKTNKIDSAYKYSQLTLKQFDLAKNNKEKTFNLLYKNDYEQAQKLNAKIKKNENEKQSNLIGSFIGLLTVLSLITFYFLRKEKKEKNELIEHLNNQKDTEKDKKEYNIDENLETKILDKITEINTKLTFLKSDFSVSYVAEKLNTNATYVSFVFNKHYNESFKQYFTKRKIEYIVQQLKTNKVFKRYSIQALAEEAGYTNASAFTRAFKKQMGITPSAYLKTLDE